MAFHQCFLEVGKNFRLLIQSCRFFCLVFFSRPFHEKFKFLKNCPNDYHKILHSHSTPKGAPVCPKASVIDSNLKLSNNKLELPHRDLWKKRCCSFDSINLLVSKQNWIKSWTNLTMKFKCEKQWLMHQNQENQSNQFPEYRPRRFAGQNWVGSSILSEYLDLRHEFRSMVRARLELVFWRAW